MVLAIIQARRGSTRLPDKAFADIGGKPMIQHVVERARLIRGIDDLVVAVPYGQRGFFQFDCAVTIAPNVREPDVLGRFAVVARTFPRHDTLIRITGDCPLFNADIASRVLELYREAHAWYAWNVHPGYTDGEDVEVFKRAALLRADMEATDPSDREHVTPFLRRHYPVVTLKPTGPQRRKTSIDTEDDLAYVRSLVTR